MSLKDNSRFDVSKFKKLEKTYVTHEELHDNFEEYAVSDEYKQKVEEERKKWRDIHETIRWAYVLAGLKSSSLLPAYTPIVGKGKVGFAKIA